MFSSRWRRSGLDLVWVLDTTGSMGTYLGEIQHKLMSVLEELGQHVSDLRCGVVAFKDHGAEGEDQSYLTRSLPLTERLDHLAEFLRSPALLPGVGGGGAEALECALSACNGFAWRPDARRAVIVVGDKPPHGGGLDGFDGCPRHIDYRDELEGLRQQDVAVYTIRVGDCLATRRVFEYLSARTGGTYMDLLHVRDLPSSIVSVCHKEAGDLTAYRRRLEQAGRLSDTGRLMIQALSAAA